MNSSKTSRSTFSPDEVYLFSPRGQIYDLAQGSTAVDFAYAVHTDIGNTCVACRIDRRLAPLSATLESGQTVEIITAPGAQPNPAWLSFVVTGKARASIRHALKNQQRNESVILGRRLLDRSLQAHDLNLKDVSSTVMNTMLEEKNFDSLDDLLEAIGLGNLMAYVVVRRLTSNPDVSGEVATLGPLAIMGTEGMVVSYAKCCKPIKGDPIIGHISAGRGIVIHTDTCKNMVEVREKPEEAMDVRWDPEVDQEFSVELKVELEHERGIIAVLASTITNTDANIERINLIEKDARLGTVNIVLTVKDRIHLAHVIKRIRLIKGINKILRTKNQEREKIL